METPVEYTTNMARKSKTRRSHLQQLLPQKSDYVSMKQYNYQVRRMSPSAFIRLKYHVHVPLEDKRQRVTACDFRILDIGEHEELCRKNYNMNQLKLMTKHYAIRISGNKQQVLSRLYNYLRLSKYARKIQAQIRRYTVSRFFKSRGPAVKSRRLCVNDTDFYTLDSIDEIPVTHFVSISESNSKSTYIYGFHIDSLIQYVKLQSDQEITNPYTREPFQTNIKLCIRECIRTAKTLGVTIDNTKDLWEDVVHATPEQEMRQLLQMIDDMGHLGAYTNPVWFEELSLLALRNFCLIAYDIWDYRIGMPPQIKRDMCGGSTCMAPYSRNIFSTNHSREQLMKVATAIVRNLTTKGLNTDLKKNGAVIVIMALTSVHNDVRNSFPALYESLI